MVCSETATGHEEAEIGEPIGDVESGRTMAGVRKLLITGSSPTHSIFCCAGGWQCPARRRRGISCGRRYRPTLGEKVLRLSDEPLQKPIAFVKRLFRLQFLRKSQINLPRVIPEGKAIRAKDTVEDVAEDEGADLTISFKVLSGNLAGIRVDIDTDDSAARGGDMERDKTQANWQYKEVLMESL